MRTFFSSLWSAKKVAKLKNVTEYHIFGLSDIFLHNRKILHNLLFILKELDIFLPGPLDRWNRLCLNDEDITFHTAIIDSLLSSSWHTAFTHSLLSRKIFWILSVLDNYEPFRKLRHYLHDVIGLLLSQTVSCFSCLAMVKNCLSRLKFVLSSQYRGICSYEISPHPPEIFPPHLYLMFPNYLTPFSLT